MHIFVYTSSPIAIYDWTEQTIFLCRSLQSNSGVKYLCTEYQQFVSVSDHFLSPLDGISYTMNYFDYHQKCRRKDGVTCYQSSVYNTKIVPAPEKTMNESVYESQDLYFLINELNNGKLPVVVKTKIQETVKKIIGKGKVCNCTSLRTKKTKCSKLKECRKNTDSYRCVNNIHNTVKEKV